MRTANKETKDKFIFAAIDEMQEHGIADFSIRRVAARCGTTSGAPYRHFKDRNALIIEVLRYINAKWNDLEEELIKEYKTSYRELLIAMSMQYIGFLHNYPEFQTIITLNDRSMTPEQLMEKARISDKSSEIIAKYCKSVGMSKADKIRKTYAVRSFIYGAALMINSGFMPYNEETLEYARSCIDREFDLP